MKKIAVLAVTISLVLIACVDKKEEEQKAAELDQKIEAVDQETNQDLEALEKEAEEIDNAIHELDSL